MPKVSVVMSVYNGERFLREAIDSILAQTFTDWEFIVVDDGSTDATPAILRSYGDRLCVHTQSNKGLTRALNIGLSLARGEYIARMDADDIAEPERLEMQVAYLDDHPQVGLVGTAYYEIDEQGNILRMVTMPLEDAEIRRALAKFNPFMHASVMFRRSLIEMWGPYTERELFWAFQDYEMWVRLAQHCQVANLPQPLMRRRLQGRNLSIQYENNRLHCNVIIRARAIHAFNLPVWYWWYVLQPAVALLLPPALRTLLRRVKYGGRTYR